MLSLCDYFQLCAPDGTRNHAMFAKSGCQAHCDTGTITIHTVCVVQIPLTCRENSVCMLAPTSTDWVLLGVNQLTAASALCADCGNSDCTNAIASAFASTPCSLLSPNKNKAIMMS